MADKPSENSEMSALAEASMLVHALAEPRPAADSVKAALQRASRKLSGWAPSRVRDIWYADPRIRVSAEEMGRLRVAARRARQEEAEAHDALQLVLARLARIEALLEANAHETGEVAVEARREPRAPHRPMDR